MKFVVLHGTKGNPEMNWFPWLARKLQENGHEVLVPRLPTPENHSLASWRQAFQKQVGELDKGAVLVGHSLGATFILRLLEDGSARAAFLVSPVIGPIGNQEYDVLNEDFYRGGFNWAEIRRHAGEIHLYQGDDDPYVPQDMGEEVAQELGIERRIIPGGGHLNFESGFTEFPQLLTDLQKTAT